MQNRYAADIGDFVKLAILRALSNGRNLGVLWWLYPDEAHNADGKHVAYLNAPGVWRKLDPELFDGLHRIIETGRRNVAELQAASLLPGATYFSEMVPTSGISTFRRAARSEWFERAEKAVEHCNMLFLDPDNGLETARYDFGRVKAGKSVALSELLRLKRDGRSMVIYHHHTRMRGGNLVELAHWGARLRDIGFQVDALRASAGTARAFFLLNGTELERERAAEIAKRWVGRISWHPNLSS